MNEKSKKHQRQLQLAKILFESGMEIPTIETITGVAGYELLALQIFEGEKDKKQK